MQRLREATDGAGGGGGGLHWQRGEPVLHKLQRDACWALLPRVWAACTSGHGSDRRERLVAPRLPALCRAWLRNATP